MYNESRKQAFIKRGNNVRSYSDERLARLDSTVIALFNASEKYEELYKKDLCEFDAKEIKNIFSNSLGKSNSATKNYLNIILRYKRWCDSKGYKTSLVDNIQIDTVQKFKDTMVSSPLHLENILNSCFAPVKSETAQCVYVGFYWCAFMGIPFHEVTEIKTEEVDLVDRIITHNGVTYKIYENAVPCFKVLRNATSFNYERHTKINPSIPRKESPYLFRSIKTPKPTLYTVNSAASKLMTKKIGRSYTYEDILRSGIFFRFYEKELANLSPEIYEFAVEMCKNSKSTGSVLGNFINKTKNNLTKDYESWKEAFVPNKK